MKRAFKHEKKFIIGNKSWKCGLFSVFFFVFFICLLLIVNFGEGQNTIYDPGSYTVSEFDGAIVTGTQVINAVRYFDTVENDKPCIAIDNGKSTSYYIYQSMTKEEKSKSKITDAYDISNFDTYIHPNALFKGSVIQDKKTQKPVGIIFAREGIHEN